MCIQLRNDAVNGIGQPGIHPDAGSLELGDNQSLLGGAHAAALNGLLRTLHQLSRILQDGCFVVPQQ